MHCRAGAQQQCACATERHERKQREPIETAATTAAATTAATTAATAAAHTAS